MAIKARSIKGARVVHLDLATGTLQCAREQKLSTELLVVGTCKEKQPD